jgi:hypothetical protein
MQATGQLHAPTTLLPGKPLRYPPYGRPGGAQTQYERHGKKKYILVLLGIKPQILDRLFPSVVVTPTELSRLPSSRHISHIILVKLCHGMS